MMWRRRRPPRPRAGPPRRAPAARRAAVTGGGAAGTAASSAGAAGDTGAAGGTGANELRIFDREAHRAIGFMTMPKGVYGLDWSMDGKTVAVAGGDGEVLRCSRFSG